MRRFATLALTLALSSPPVVAQSVLVVTAADGSLGVVDAVGAASPGDTIVVKPGTYVAPSIAKPLHLVGDGPRGSVTLSGQLKVQGTGPNDLVVLRNLRIQGFGGASSAAIALDGNQGTVWIEECEVIGPRGPGNFATHALDVSAGLGGVPTLVVVRSELTGGDGVDTLGLPLPQLGEAMSVSDLADVFLFDSVLAAGVEHDPNVSSVSPALQITGGDVFASGCTFLGADGTDSVGGFDCGTDGAPGVRVSSGALTVLDSTAVGGAAGVAGTGSCGPTTDGPPILVDPSGSLATLPGTARHFEADAPVAAGGTLTFTAGGEPGDLVLLVVSANISPIVVPGTGGLLLAPPSLTRVLGFVPPSGELVVAPTLNSIDPDLVLNVFAQAVFVTPAPGLALGPGSALQLLATAP